jgi:hypothetical protein
MSLSFRCFVALHAVLYRCVADAATYNVQFFGTSDCTGTPSSVTNVPDSCADLPGTNAIYGLALSSTTVAVCTEDAESGSGEDNCNARTALSSQAGVPGCTVSNFGSCIQAPGQNVYVRLNKIKWVRTSGNAKTGRALCAGYVTECATQLECSKTFIGPCDNATTSSSKYIESEFTGLAFVDVNSYVACAEPGSGAGPSCEFGTIYPDPSRIYRDLETVTASNGTAYSYTMTGMGFGNDKVGAYAGVASYLITGTRSISSSTNKLYLWTPNKGSAAVQRGDSNIGAPEESKPVCISEIIDGKCSSVKRKFPRNACECAQRIKLRATSPGCKLATSNLVPWPTPHSCQVCC